MKLKTQCKTIINIRTKLKTKLTIDLTTHKQAQMLTTNVIPSKQN